MNSFRPISILLAQGGLGVLAGLLVSCAPPSSRSVEAAFVAGALSPSELESLNRDSDDRYRDIVRVAENAKGPSEAKDSDIEKVARNFGPSHVDMSQLPYTSPTFDSGVKAWSAWWYPNFETTLFRSEKQDSPLQKYDRLRDYLYLYREQAAPERATSIAEKNFNPQSLKWEGLCNAWAFASILTPEPTVDRPFYLNSRVPVIFSPADQKALLLKTFEAVPEDGMMIYGQKFTGDFDGWIHPDLYPDQLHRFVEKTLGEFRRPFIMDHDPGVEIWNVPVFRAKYSLSAVPGRDDAVKVRLWLTTAAPLNKDEMVRQGSKENIREYHYILFGQRTGNDLEVRSGMWIVGDNGTDSRRSHPDYVIDIPDPKKLVRQSFNAAVEPSLVDAIIKGATIR